MVEGLALVIGYLLGSVLPADLLARRRGVDIRAVGTRNPGATNALQQLGTTAGLLTGAYDALVGLVSMGIAHLLGLSAGWVYLSGVAAIVGHCFPVFFGFHGGQGMAATTGLLIYELGVALWEGSLSIEGIAALAAVSTAVFTWTRSGTLVGTIAAPLLVVQILLGPGEWELKLFMTGLSGFIWAVQLMIARQQHLGARLVGGPRRMPHAT